MGWKGAKPHNKDPLEEEFGNNLHIGALANFRLCPENTRKTNAAAEFNNEQKKQA